MKFTCLKYLIPILFLLHQSSFIAGQGDCMQGKTTKDRQIILDVGGMYEYSGLALGTQLTYLQKASEHNYFGARLGRGSIFRDQFWTGLGAIYRHTFSGEMKGPYMEAELSALHIKNVYYGSSLYSTSDNVFTRVQAGGAGYLYLGYAFRKPSRHLGFNARLGLGASLEKSIIPDVVNTSFEYGSYGLVRRSKLTIGMIYTL